MKPGVLATREDAEIYLIQTEREKGCILSRDDGLLPEGDLQQLLKSAPWVKFDGDPKPILKLYQKERATNADRPKTF